MSILGLILQIIYILYLFLKWNVPDEYNLWKLISISLGHCQPCSNYFEWLRVNLVGLKRNITLPRFIELPVPSQESERSCIMCFKDINFASIFILSVRFYNCCHSVIFVVFLLDSKTVPTVCYFLFFLLHFRTDSTVWYFFVFHFFPWN